MKVKQFQIIHEIQSNNHDEVDALALIVCEVYGLSYDEVNDINPAKFLKLSKNIKIKTDKPLINWLRFETDSHKITLGQFIECQTWLKNSAPVKAMHLVAASILKSKKPHKDKVDKILNTHIKNVYHYVSDFILSLNDLINSYSGLFEIEVDLDEEIEKPEAPHPFIDRYGWVFSAKTVAEFEGITIDKAYDLPILHALNTMSYLKAKQKFDKWQSKQ